MLPLRSQDSRLIEGQPREIATAATEGWRYEPRWPWPLRLLVMVAAASLCWAVIVLLVYWLWV